MENKDKTIKPSKFACCTKKTVKKTINTLFDKIDELEKRLHDKIDRMIDERFPSSEELKAVIEKK